MEKLVLWNNLAVLSSSIKIYTQQTVCIQSSGEKYTRLSKTKESWQKVWPWLISVVPLLWLKLLFLTDQVYSHPIMS